MSVEMVIMNVGYKGVVHIHPGYVSCPTNPFESTRWQDRLRELELKFASWLKIGNVSREGGLQDVTWMMQVSYPGNYTVVEAYDAKRGVFGFKLKFDDPKEELIWLMKWS